MGEWKWRPVGDRSHDFRCDGKVVTLSDGPNKFYDEADIRCLKCGQTGYLFVDGDEGVDFIWYKKRHSNDSEGGGGGVMGTQQQRLENVNEFIRIIASCGRQFFSHKGTVSTMELDERGRVWFIDYYTGERIYTHYRHEWRGFTSGGTLRRLVEFFRKHIKTGLTLNPRYFEVNEVWCSGHPWGYPHDDLAMLDHEARRLGIIHPTSEEE